MDRRPLWGGLLSGQERHDPCLIPCQSAQRSLFVEQLLLEIAWAHAHRLCLDPYPGAIGPDDPDVGASIPEDPPKPHRRVLFDHKRSRSARRAQQIVARSVPSPAIRSSKAARKKDLGNTW